VCDLETYSTDLQWCPVRTKQAGSDVFAVACTDGSFKLFAKTGRLEKSVEAHQGACISLRWNHEGACSLGVSLVCRLFASAHDGRWVVNQAALAPVRRHQLQSKTQFTYMLHDDGARPSRTLRA
jgi:hypothetical protein